jgi:hypothetical protein
MLFRLSSFWRYFKHWRKNQILHPTWLWLLNICMRPSWRFVYLWFAFSTASETVVCALLVDCYSVHLLNIVTFCGRMHLFSFHCYPHFRRKRYWFLFIFLLWLSRSLLAPQQKCCHCHADVCKSMHANNLDYRLAKNCIPMPLWPKWLISLPQQGSNLTGPRNMGI